MSMSRRDFEAIAKIIRENTTKSVEEPLPFIYKDYLVDELCDYFSTRNPRFDGYRFGVACRREVENDTSNSDCSAYPPV